MIVYWKQLNAKRFINNYNRATNSWRDLVLARLQKKTKRKTTREVKSNQMNKKQEELTKVLLVKGLYKITDKLEQRISTLEKVLQSHAKCIGEMREDKKDES